MEGDSNRLCYAQESQVVYIIQRRTMGLILLLLPDGEKMCNKNNLLLGKEKGLNLMQ